MIRLCLCLIEHKVLQEVKFWSHILFYALDGSELLASRPGPLIPGERTSDNNLICGSAGHSAGPDTEEKSNLLPLLGIEPKFIG
jgi:hypothetical protein